MREGIQSIWRFCRRRKHHVAAVLLLTVWCWPYYLTGNRVEWGDFTFFSQAYEAIRLSILHYHQFPWWNPWISGGVPLYANPQIGVFSIQTIFVLIAGAPLGLKLALIVYTFGGYCSAYLLLHKYFKVQPVVAAALSLLSIFCSFYVGHLPAHFTFAWYLLAPGFIYLALTVKSYKSGLYLGLAFAIMGLSQIHNPFVHIGTICGIIIVVRLITEAANRLQVLKSLGLAAGVFLLLTGHRLLLTLQNLHQFTRTDLADQPPSLLAALMGPFVPLSLAHPLRWMPYPGPPASGWYYNEVTSTLGICFLIALAICIVLLARRVYKQPKQTWEGNRPAILAFGFGMICYVLGYGRFARFAPYNVLKHLPVFSQMRVSSRWFIFFDISMLIFVGITISRLENRTKLKKALTILLMAGVAETFVFNLGYQANILAHTPLSPPKPGYSYPFEQTSYFGKSLKLSDGSTMKNDGNMPHEYREYEATRFNQGILYANDSLVQLALDKRRNPGHPTCPVEEGCPFVRSGNAKVTYWSPNKITLTRTKPGDIYLNANNSSYFVINGKRDKALRVAEPFTDFVIKDPARIISIVTKPSVTNPISKRWSF